MSRGVRDRGGIDQIRRRINAGAMGQGLGAARDLGPGRPRTGPVAVRNLLAKRRATLRVPARPPRGPPAGDRARRAQPAQRAGDLAPGLPRRRRRSCDRRPTRSRSSATCRWRCAGSCSGTGRASAAHAAGPGAAPEAARRPGRPVRRGLQPVPRLDEPGRRMGAPQGADGLHRRGGDPPRGQPVRGAPVPALARGAAAASRRLRRRSHRGRSGVPEGLRAAAARACRAASGHGAVHDPARGRDRAAGRARRGR